MEQDIIKEYQSNLYSIEDLCKKYKIGKLKIKKFLSENNISIRTKGGQIKHNNLSINKEQFENKSLQCKHCNKEFNDIENKNGTIITHIKKCFPDIIIPSKFKRTMYKKDTGMYWHVQFFNIIDKKINNNILSCPLCDWKTFDITNKTGSFTKHIIKNHMSINEFINLHKEYSKYFNVFNKTEQMKSELILDYVKCKICGKKMKFINNRHLKEKHNITPYEYKIMYPNEMILNNKTNELFKKNLIESNLNMTPTWTSSGENELKNFIQELGFNAEKGKNRKLLNGKEIDIIIEDLKLCFEYNGLYYHRENMGKDSSYHLNKTQECYNIGYKLYQIFEDEWLLKKDIVKDKIKYLLKIGDFIKIGGRNVIIKKIEQNEKSIFLNENHIQGNDKSTIHYGAFYNDLLVGVVTFNSKRNMTKTIINQYELSRFAIKRNYSISGLMSKFLKVFISEYNPQSIISFADRRWTPDGNDNLYINSGFKLINILPPDYTYYNSKINRYKRFHKFGFGKTSLKNKYPQLDFNKSEKELTKELGFEKIWDCGLFKYEMIL